MRGEVIPLHAAPQRFLPPEREMPDNAVFISYAREDLPAVQKLKAGLDAAGVKTWFDLERLESGDDYDRKIQRNIARCSFFIPIVSANTERRLEGYFRREWSYAIDRARNIAEGALFILPVCIDDTDGGAGAGAGQVQGRAFHAAAGWRSHAGIRAPHAGPAVVAPRMNDVAAPPAIDEMRLAVDAEHPWLGLASFTEETRGYFYGRDEEVAELGRRVQRKLLTILFGQSGLGKTSILRAGIVPRLRPEGYCPVYVRIDYSPESPAPTEQIKQADLPRDASGGRVDAAGHGGIAANRCGSSCTIATTSCATRPARRSFRC